MDALKLGTNIQGAQRMNPNYFGDPLTFILAPPVAKNVHLTSDGLAQNVMQTLMVTRG